MSYSVIMVEKESHPFLFYWAVFFSYVMSMFIILPFLGLYAISLGATSGMVGILYGSSYVAGFFACLPAAALADRFGNRFFIIVGMIMNAIGLIIIILVRIPELIILGVILQGAGFAVFQPSMFSYLLQSIDGKSNKDRLIGFTLTSPPLAQFLSPALGSTMILVGGFLGVFGMAVVLGWSCLFLGIQFITGGMPANPELRVNLGSMVPAIRSVLTKSLFPALSIRSACAYVYGSSVAFLPLMAHQIFGYEAVDVGILFSIASIANIISRPCGAYLTKIKGSRFVFVVGMLFTVPGTLLFAFPLHHFFLWIGLSLNGFGLGCTLPASIELVGRVVPSERRTFGMGFLTASIGLGAFAGSLISVIMLEVGGFTLLFLISALIALVALASQFLPKINSI